MKVTLIVMQDKKINLDKFICIELLVTLICACAVKVNSLKIKSDCEAKVVNQQQSRQTDSSCKKEVQI